VHDTLYMAVSVYFIILRIKESKLSGRLDFFKEKTNWEKTKWPVTLGWLVKSSDIGQ